jgi:hypothetical protein
VWRCIEGVQQTATDDTGREIVVGEASLLTVGDREEQEEAIDCPRRRRRTEGAETPKTFLMSIVVSCGSGDRKRWRTELDFGGSESFDDHHWPTALGTAPKIFRSVRVCRVWAGLRL